MWRQKQFHVKKIKFGKLFVCFYFLKQLDMLRVCFKTQSKSGNVFELKIKIKKRKILKTWASSRRACNNKCEDKNNFTWRKSNLENYLCFYFLKQLDMLQVCCKTQSKSGNVFELKIKMEKRKILKTWVASNSACNNKCEDKNNSTWRKSNLESYLCVYIFWNSSTCCEFASKRNQNQEMFLNWKLKWKKEKFSKLELLQVEPATTNVKTKTISREENQIWKVICVFLFFETARHVASLLQNAIKIRKCFWIEN